MKPLVQYQTSRDLTQTELRKIATSFLKNDHRWHFFHEGNHCLLRLKSRSYLVEKWLRSKKIKFTISVWEDPHKTVRTYQDVFEGMFHGFTILGLFNKHKDFPRAYDRVVHCFCNMSGKNSNEELLALQEQFMGRLMLYTRIITLSAVEQYLKKNDRTK